MYDYGRVGKDGKKCDLHIEKALAVTNRVPIVKDKSSYPHVMKNEPIVEPVSLTDAEQIIGNVMKKLEGTVSDASFASILMLDGEGVISCQGETLEFRKGDSFFLSAGSGTWTSGTAGNPDGSVRRCRNRSSRNNRQNTGNRALFQ